MIRRLMILFLVGCATGESEPAPVVDEQRTLAPQAEVSQPSLDHAPAPPRRLYTEEEARLRRQRYVGTTSDADWKRYVRPLIEKLQLPVVPWARSLGLTEFGSDTPENARRARTLIEADSHRNAYIFYQGSDAPSDDKK
jgi:hypothetical protein